MTNNVFVLAKPIIYYLPKAIFLLLVIFFILLRIIRNVPKQCVLRNICLILIILIGIYYRFCFAYYLQGTYDLWYWQQAASWALAGKNIYAVSPWYNYFPPWLIIITTLKKISLIWTRFNFNLLVRAFLTLVDLITVYFLYLFAKLKNKNFFQTVIAFFLNPISVLISGFHGQFENLAILMIIMGIYFQQKYKKFYLSWLLITFGGIVKHMLINQPLIYLIYYFKKKTTIIFYFFISMIIALLTLVPYLSAGKLLIRDFLLSVYTTKNYGVLFILKSLSLNFLTRPYTYIFIITFLLFSWMVKSKDLRKNCLLSVLFFLVFSPSMSDQFFVLPLALASLRPSLYFYLYTLFASFYLFGSSAQFNIPFFKIFSWNYIFVISLFWLISEYRTKNTNG